MEDCLHCNGAGVEPYTEDEKCCICLGERTVPEGMNEQYYDRVMEALDGDE